MNNPAYGHIIITNGADDMARVGDTVTRTPKGLSDLDGANPDIPPVTTWFRDGAVIPDAQSHKYTVQEDDIGKSLSAHYSFVDGTGALETIRTRHGLFVTDDHIEAVRVLYPFALGRAPDLNGLLYWAGFMRTLNEHGIDRVEALAKMAEAFRTSDAYAQEHERR